MSLITDLRYVFQESLDLFFYRTLRVVIKELKMETSFGMFV